ncbi:MAG: hypothetical protein EZS28_028027 [Streblomastix strix]|uniref:Uncharacterized protein n=1 Tax=Streblomastix strix TaxID=222440 RepID=A0A5J4V0E1_9EUKA|nr:MAG: hypothetical protein EZS28_028027 [Streblomastix strix]
MRLVSNSEIQFVHVHRRIRHDLQGKNDANTDGYDRTRERTKNRAVTSNTSRIQQLDAEIVTSTTLNQKSTFSFGRYIFDENLGLHENT